jgi:hypothetical protein
MANPTSRSELKEYCLRRLGKGVIDINVSDEQIDDRLDEALQFFQEYHFDGVERTYLKHKVTATTITITTSNVDSFSIGEVVTGQTSGATARVYDFPTNDSMRVKYEVGDFTDGETIEGRVSSHAAVIDAIVEGDIKLKYLPVSDAIIGVVKIFPFNNSSSVDMFDVRYQMHLNDLFDMSSTSIMYYDMVKRHLSLIEMELGTQPPIRFNRKMDRVFVDMDWQSDVRPDDYLIVEAFRILDPNTYTEVYNDMFLKKYATALIKQQWGSNLSKFSGVQMPGGVTLDGVRILQEANEEIAKIEEEMQLRYELPPEFITG